MTDKVIQPPIKTPMSFMTRVIVIVVGVVVVAAIGAGSYYAKQSQDLKVKLEELKKNPQAETQAEVNRLAEEIGQLIALPEGEAPTLATVTGKENLADSPFFAKAENGDKVLIYVKARKAYLYRPSAKKLMEVAAVNLNTGASSQTAGEAAGETEAVRVFLRNGTATAGLTRAVEDKIKEKLPQVTIADRDNAGVTGRKETLVVDLTGSHAALAQTLASALEAAVGTLPEGESKPDADILIILGTDQIK